MIPLTHPENRDLVCGATKGDLVCLEPAGHDYPHHDGNGSRWVDHGQSMPAEASYREPVSDDHENLATFVRLKILDVENAIIAREQSQTCFLSGDDKEWQIAAKLASKMAGRCHAPMSQAERLAISEREGRILVKLRRELGMFNRILKLVE